MNEATKKAIATAFADAVKGQINDNRNHGWGAKDSQAVIEAVIAEDATHEIKRLIAEKKDPTSYTPTEFAMEAIAKVINPSAYRQTLEKAKRPDGQTVLAKSTKIEAEKAVFDLYS